MSILKDRIRPLDPSSLQKFLGPDPQGEGEEGSVEPLATPPSTLLGTTSFQLASRSVLDTAMGDQPRSEHDVEVLDTTS
jgi:hypothetical protein